MQRGASGGGLFATVYRCQTRQSKTDTVFSLDFTIVFSPSYIVPRAYASDVCTCDISNLRVVTELYFPKYIRIAYTNARVRVTKGQSCDTWVS